MRRRSVLIAAGSLLGAGAAGALGWRFATGSTADYATAMAALRRPVDAGLGHAEWLRCATLAANGHNTQPWRFRVGASAIEILPDFARRTPVVDPDDHHVWASLGCAAANLEIAAAASGRVGTTGFIADGDGALRFTHEAGTAATSPLLEAIPRRQSTRGDYDGRAVSAADLDRLVDASATDGVDLVLFTAREAVDRVRDLVIAGNSAQMADPAFVRELRDWIRFSPREALARGDGLYAASSGNPTLPDAVGRRLFEFVFKAEAENDRYARQLDSSAGVALFVAERDEPAHWARAGMACQRFALMATTLNIRTAYVNQPTEVPALRGDLAALGGLSGRRPNLLLRFGPGPLLPYSPRRPPAIA